MTIRTFARLCGCNPQTLRYYDRVGLLRPARVDEQSGYRFYDEKQALVFVKIKNLQEAGFTIEEIRPLLPAGGERICEAFAGKIAQQEAHLAKIRKIQQSYHAEMDQMRQKLTAIQEAVSRSMQAYDPTEEFGIDEVRYARIVSDVSDFIGDMIRRADDSGFECADDSEQAGEPDLLHDPDYALVYERHGWAHVKDFLQEFADLADGAEYALVFKLAKDPEQEMAFANTMLTVLLDRNPGKKRKLGCSVHHSEDGINHFWLLRKRV